MWVSHFLLFYFSFVSHTHIPWDKREPTRWTDISVRSSLSRQLNTFLYKTHRVDLWLDVCREPLWPAVFWRLPLTLCLCIALLDLVSGFISGEFPVSMEEMLDLRHRRRQRHHTCQHVNLTDNPSVILALRGDVWPFHHAWATAEWSTGPLLWHAAVFGQIRRVRLHAHHFLYW